MLAGIVETLPIALELIAKEAENASTDKYDESGHKLPDTNRSAGKAVAAGAGTKIYLGSVVKPPIVSSDKGTNASTTLILETCTVVSALSD